MSQEMVSKRYAKALFEIGLEQKKLDEISEDLKLVETAFRSRELRELLAHPITTIENKRNVISKLFKNVDSLTLHFLYVILDHSRESIINDVITNYFEFVNREKGCVEVKVTSPIPMGKEDNENLIDTFKRILKKEIKVKEIAIDKSLLGGVVVQVGDRIFDGSLKTRLTKFQERLKEMPVQT